MTNPRIEQLYDALNRRILILDGAMGTMLQKFRFADADFKGTAFRDHPHPLAGNNDILNLTQPQAVLSVHARYLEAGADIIETNTFNSNAVSQAEYGLESRVYDIARAGAALARSAADAVTEQTPDRPRFVAGSIGPTGKTLSMSADVSDPAAREITFSQLAAAYETAVAGLVDGGADILLIETVFDTLNAKAALYAIAEFKRKRGIDRIPVMVSGTISDASGRLLAGQSAEAFLISVTHCPDLLSVGFNCALGAAEMRPWLAELASKAPCLISAHPNAGLPDELGRYRQTPEEMARIMRSFADDGLLNIAGGCCGTNPDHIRAIAGAMNGAAPRRIPDVRPALRLAGLDPLVSNPELPFLNVGERTNVAGSRKFLRLIREGNTDEAVRIARGQIENGACIIDVNMDDAMLDAGTELSRFLRRLAGEPDIARVPVMIDSSRWDAILSGLSCAQGKCIVNSISLKEGEDVFLEHARQARLFGAALLCMAFDENGQADTLDRRVSVCRRMYRLLTEKAAVPPSDIIFDVNVFAVATGLPEHDSYARDFIEAVRILRRDFPDAHFSGGISNVSFSFRGNEPVRAALHSVFLYHAVRAGLDMGIVNPAQLDMYEDIDPVLRSAAEAVILNTSPDAGSKLLEIASSFRDGGDSAAKQEKTAAWRAESVEKRISLALVRGDDSFLADDLNEALNAGADPVGIIEGPLMDGMSEVGVRFGAGKMFLPQVVKTARVMKNAVSHLMPAIREKQADSGAGMRRPTVVLATVKGDVHDIGKNIVGVVLQCNNFRVIDLGVMVPCETIVDTAVREHADIIALSGLITPSLEEMGNVAAELERRNLSIPLMVGGAAASVRHTALRLQPKRPASGIVVYTSDASQCAPVAVMLADPEKRGAFIRRTLAEYEKLRNGETPAPVLIPFAEASEAARPVSDPAPLPAKPGLTVLRPDKQTVLPYFNRDAFCHAWKLNASAFARAERESLLRDAETMLAEFPFDIRTATGIFPAGRRDNDIVLYTAEDRAEILRVLPMLRRQTRGTEPLSLADFIAPEGDHLACFMLTAGHGVAERAEAYRNADDDYSALLLQILAGHVAEAAAEYLHRLIRTELWGFEAGESLSMRELFDGKARGIRPAVGYPICPDHTLKRDLSELLFSEKNAGITLTDSMMMNPSASVCALVFANPAARYFQVGKIGGDQLADYARRRGVEPDILEKFLAQ